MKKSFKSDEKNIALLRVKRLFNEAEKVFSKDPQKASRYVEIARKISMKVKIKIPSSLKRKFCKYCYSYLASGINCRVRNRKGKVVYSCFNCKKYMRFPYVKEKKAERSKKD